MGTQSTAGISMPVSVTSIIVNDFYKVPITIAFMVSSVYAVCITKGLSLNERMLQYSIGAANKNIMLMILDFHPGRRIRPKCQRYRGH